MQHLLGFCVFEFESQSPQAYSILILKGTRRSQCVNHTYITCVAENYRYAQCRPMKPYKGSKARPSILEPNTVGLCGPFSLGAVLELNARLCPPLHHPDLWDLHVP